VVAVSGGARTQRFSLPRLASRRDPLRDGFIIAATLWTLAIAAGVVPPGGDAAGFYEHAWPNPYDVLVYGSDAGFYYSPPVALLFAVMSTFGLAVFAAIITGAGFVALYVIAGRWAWALLFFPPVWWDLASANISMLIGAAVIVGAARPGLFAIPLLTKVTPGVTVLWFAFRRDWRSLAVAGGITGTICLVSFLIAPRLWFEWIALLLAQGPGYTGPGFFTIPIPLLPRLAVALPLLAWGALTDRRWTLPVVAFLATPVLWYTVAATLAAVAYDWRSSRTAS
jgi:hypothetical protein